jgi:hypothetical protein
MNLDDTIQELRAEKEKLERVIASLEELRATTHGIPTVATRRGRKSMGAAERHVSERMRKLLGEPAAPPVATIASGGLQLRRGECAQPTGGTAQASGCGPRRYDCVDRSRAGVPPGGVGHQDCAVPATVNILTTA